MSSATLYRGDCLDVLASMEPESVDAIVCDPPYGLGFMGKAWDALPPGEPWARACLRVLKPGGHLVAFGGTRTVHRLACAIEDGGFEIRDSIAWVQWQGFPKSLDVSKAIDRRGGAIAGFESFRDDVRAAMRRNGITRADLQRALGNYMLSHYLTAGSQPAVPNVRDYQIIRDTVGLGDGWDSAFRPAAEREEVGRGRAGISSPGDADRHTVGGSRSVEISITAPATEDARTWEGFGTALKPAHEPAILARKPLAGTVASNVLEHGTGALNIDGCRFAYGDPAWPGPNDAVGPRSTGGWQDSYVGGSLVNPISTEDPNGRWPANLYACPKPSRAEREAGCERLPGRTGAEATDRTEGTAGLDSPRAGAGRSAEHVKNHHPTVKPIGVMRWLCKLVGGHPGRSVILDPFMGSGTTGAAAMLEGFDFIGIEREPEYIQIAEARIRHHLGALFAHGVQVIETDEEAE